MRYGEQVSLERRGKGKYVKGKFYPGDPVTCCFTMSVQPISGHEIAQLPEADRSTEHIKAYSEDEILLNDVLIYRNKRYEVQSVKHWPENHHWKAFAKRVDIDVNNDNRLHHN